jgi:hypothetical protein
MNNSIIKMEVEFPDITFLLSDLGQNLWIRIYCVEIDLLAKMIIEFVFA